MSAVSKSCCRNPGSCSNAWKDTKIPQWIIIDLYHCKLRVKIYCIITVIKNKSLPTTSRVLTNWFLDSLMAIGSLDSPGVVTVNCFRVSGLFKIFSTYGGYIVCSQCFVLFPAWDQVWEGVKSAILDKSCWDMWHSMAISLCSMSHEHYELCCLLKQGQHWAEGEGGFLLPQLRKYSVMNAESQHCSIVGFVLLARVWTHDLPYPRHTQWSQLWMLSVEATGPVSPLYTTVLFLQEFIWV